MAPIVDGRADLECETVTNTAERREKVAFTIPHCVTGARIIVRADSSLQAFARASEMRVQAACSNTPANER